MVDLNGHEAGNGGYSQRKPTAHRDSSTRKLVRMPVAVEKLFLQKKIPKNEIASESRYFQRVSPHSLRQTHALEQIDVAGIGAKRLKKSFDL